MNRIQKEHVVRINNFSVPADARDEFMELIRRTHEVIRAQPGFIDDMVLEQSSGLGAFNLITILQFEGEHVLQPVIAAVAGSDEEAGIDRQALSRRLGVESTVGFYFPVALRALAAA
ncbi:antibiotic biosynthesis monooxygenase [Rhizobium puerariae]|uniref:Antibiotic biosynthesis monooxygenase n=1 Tax=Rhizobium puerariae TaxID=1585791 RepID=A0ABV6AF93_9HYPH